MSLGNITPQIHPEPTPTSLPPLKASKRGFALIATLSVLILLALIAVAMLSLSSVTLRTSSNTDSMQEARANARMALVLAISELQKQAGPDTRVTASAETVSGVNGPKQLTGVWRSWEGLNHDPSDAQPIAPDYDSKKVAYSGSNSGRFLSWLISGDEATNSADSPPQLTEGSDTVPLLTSGTLGANSNSEVHLQPSPVDNASTYAWWITGENTKARLKTTAVASSNYEASEQMLISPGPNGSAFNITDTSEADRAVTRQSANFLRQDDSALPSEYFHDLTTHSSGLLTNVANGGWKRDLSLFTENFSSIPEGFSSFTLSPGNVFQAGKSHAASTLHPIIYPWGALTDPFLTNIFPDCVSWSALADYATQYKNLTSSGEEVAQIMNATDRTYLGWSDTVRRVPVLTRTHLVVSLTARKTTDDPVTYTPAILVTPVLTVWNPYSVALDMTNRPTVTYSLSDAACPLNFDFEVTSTSTTTLTKDLAKITAHSSRNNQSLSAVVPLGSSPLWLPGEVRVFSPQGSIITNKKIGNNITFEEGYRPSSGLNYELLDASNTSFTGLTDATTFSVNKANLNATFTGPNVQGIGMYFTWKLGVGDNSTTNVQCMLNQADAHKMLGSEVTLKNTPTSLSSLETTPQPIVSIVTGLRYGRDTNPDRENIVVNGIHNMNPIVGFMINGHSSDTSEVQGRFDAFPYNIQLFPVSALEDPGMPSGIVDDLEGFIGSGFGSLDGLSNLILLEIPTRPLRTIGDLQHFNINACDDSAPYTLNAIGNSKTSPFIASDHIQVTSSSGVSKGHDHSYASNHVLLDDWFVSSVAPEMQEWSAIQERSIQEVYEQHLNGEKSLPNHYYKPANPVSVSDATTEATAFLSDTDAWMKVAAELEVNGMFNVNSTSELAWEMILKRTFGSDQSGVNNGGVLTLTDSVPSTSSSAPSATLEKSDGSPFPRSTLVSDSAAGNSAYTMLSQHKRFTDDQIRALAREIVVEIKKRGPFLSLSEFFNRQLSQDKGLALAGTVETALKRLSETNNTENPFLELQDSFPDTASTNDVLGDPLAYPFQEAAEGNPAYGFPGWTRQADVLRPISGILTVRDDTFTIRAYGDARHPVTNKIIAKTWCEAVVQRKADYVDSSVTQGDNKYTLPSDTTLTSAANKRFGRSFEIIQFRWLQSDEV